MRFFFFFGQHYQLIRISLAKDHVIHHVIYPQSLNKESRMTNTFIILFLNVMISYNRDKLFVKLLKLMESRLSKIVISIIAEG